MGVEPEDVAVLGNGVGAIAVEGGVVLPVYDLKFGRSFEEQVADRLEGGRLGLLGLCAVGRLLHEVDFGLDLCGLVDLSVGLDAKQRDVV